MLRSLTRLLCAPVVVAGMVFGQTAPKPLEFEVASIRLSDPGASQDGYSLMTNRGAGLTVKNGSVKTLIAFAYGVRDLQLSGGPGWIATDHYDITAKSDQSDGALTPPDPQSMTDDERKTRDDRMREMLRSLLAKRFGLLTHNEMRDLNAYALVVAKNGSKLKVAVPGQRQGINGNGRGRMQGFAASTASLAAVLTNMMGRPVLDKTGLTEKYDFTLEWMPDNVPTRPDAITPDSIQQPDRALPSIFTALEEQLGLQLSSARTPVETIVIDHVDKPSEN